MSGCSKPDEIRKDDIMAFDTEDIQYLDGKFETVYKKIDINRDKAENDLKNHVDKEHRGVVSKYLGIVVSAVALIGMILALLVTYLKGAIQ